MTICVVLFVFGIAYLLLLVLNIRNSSDVWTRWRYVFLFIPAAYMAYFNFDYITRKEITTLASAAPRMRLLPMQSPFEQSFQEAILTQLRLQNLISLMDSPMKTVYRPAVQPTSYLHNASASVATTLLPCTNGFVALPSAPTNSVSTSLLSRPHVKQHNHAHIVEPNTNASEFNEV